MIRQPAISAAALVVFAAIPVGCGSSGSSTAVSPTTGASGPSISAFCAYARKYSGATTTTAAGSATATTLSVDEQMVDAARQGLPFYRRAAQLAPPAVAPQLRQVLAYYTEAASADLTTEAGRAQLAKANRDALADTGALTAAGAQRLDDYMHHVCHIRT